VASYTDAYRSQRLTRTPPVIAIVAITNGNHKWQSQFGLQLVVHFGRLSLDSFCGFFWFCHSKAPATVTGGHPGRQPQRGAPKAHHRALGGANGAHFGPARHRCQSVTQSAAFTVQLRPESCHSKHATRTEQTRGQRMPLGTRPLCSIHRKLKQLSFRSSGENRKQ